MADPYGDANKQNEEAKARLLAAVAQAGTEGARQFEAAKAANTAAQQGALARAQEAARINNLGVDTGAQTGIANKYGMLGTSLANQQAGFEGSLNQARTSGTSYLEKLGTTVPVMQAQNAKRISDQEAQIKAAIQLAQQKADAAAAEKEAARLAAEKQFALAEKGRNSRADAAIAAANARANASAARAQAPTLDSLLGQASQIKTPALMSKVQPAIDLQATKIPVGAKPGSLGSAFQSILGAHTQSAVQGAGGQQVVDIGKMSIQDIAARLGQAQGATPNVINSLYSPSKVASVATAIKKNEPLPAPDAQAILATKVPTVDSKVAADIAKDSQYKEVVGAVSDFLNAPVDEAGKISDDGEYKGLTPYDAYVKYFNGKLDAKKTRTRAVLGAQFRPLFQNLSRA